MIIKELNLGPSILLCLKESYNVSWQIQIDVGHLCSVGHALEFWWAYAYKCFVEVVAFVDVGSSKISEEGTNKATWWATLAENIEAELPTPTVQRAGLSLHSQCCQKYGFFDKQVDGNLLSSK